MWLALESVLLHIAPKREYATIERLRGRSNSLIGSGNGRLAVRGTGGKLSHSSRLFFSIHFDMPMCRHADYAAFEIEGKMVKRQGKNVPQKQPRVHDNERASRSFFVRS